MRSNGDIAIAVRGVDKSFTIVHSAQQYATLAETVLHRLKRPLTRPSRETFWALKDVNFEVKRGDVLGIIGRNGAGKSTLLKILSRITEPTAGEIELHGRVGSLLEVGTGFHPELTGRENIFLNGAILGMRKAEIRKQFDAIVDFAGIERFLDTPVKRYSSGMYVRLAFAVAAHLEPEILIVDEVLAVGDTEFQQKCLGKIGSVAQEGRTVLFVSHNSSALSTLCTRAILLEKGKVRADVGVAEALQIYAEMTDRSDEGVVLRRSPDLTWGGFVDHPNTHTITPADDVSFSMAFQSGSKPLSNVEIDCEIINSRGYKVVHARTDVVHQPFQMSRNSRIVASFEILKPQLMPGTYTLTVFVRSAEQELYWAERAAHFVVSAQIDFGISSGLASLKGITLPRYTLTIAEQ